MRFARFALALPAVFMLGTAQLTAQERGQERMQETPTAQQDACQVSFYMVEDTQTDEFRQDDMRQDRPGDYQPGQQERQQQPGIGQQQHLGMGELPLRGEQVTTLPVQDEPLTLWAEFSPALEQPQSVRVEAQQTGVRLEQAFALHHLQTDDAGVAQDTEWMEREERVGEQDRIEHAGQQPGMPGETRVEAALLQLETAGATEGQIQVIFQGATQRCTGSIQIGDEMRDDFRQDELERDPMDEDPFDPEPREDDPFDPDPEA